MLRLLELSPELLCALLAHLTYEEAASLLKPSCKTLLALCGPGVEEDDPGKTAVIQWQPATPEFELCKTLRRIERQWGFLGESRKLNAMAKLLHELHERGVVRIEEDPVGQYLLDYTSAETDLRSLRCVFGFHLLQVLEPETWFAACFQFVVENDILRLEDASPYIQIRCMFQTLGLTGSMDTRVECGDIIAARWRFGDRGYYSNTKRYRALMRAVDAARQGTPSVPR